MSSENIGTKVRNLLIKIVRFEIYCLMLGFSLGIISGVMDFSNMCFKRYNFDNLTSTNYQVQSSVTVRGDGNYTATTKTVNGKSVLSVDDTKYGQWVRANFAVRPNQNLQISVSGNLSLCRAYLPAYNLQNRTLPSSANSNTIYQLDSSGKKIPIPRIEENKPPITLIFDARSTGWRNLTEVYRNDIVSVILKDNVIPNAVPRAIPTDVTNADCALLTNPTERNNCTKALSGGNTIRNGTISDCDNLAPDIQASCRAQYTANAKPAMTLAECNGMPPAIQAQCISQIPKPTAATPPPPPITVAVTPGLNPRNIAVTDSITNVTTVADCSEGKTQYSPICGRWSLWNGTASITDRCIAHYYCYSTRHRDDWCCQAGCDASPKGYLSNDEGDYWVPIPRGRFWGRYRCLAYTWGPPFFYRTHLATAPPPYKDDASLNIPVFRSPSGYPLLPQNLDCNNSAARALIPTKFWFTATDASGLQYRFDNSLFPTNQAAAGSNYSWATIITSDNDQNPDEYSGRKIYSGTYTSSNVAYLQYRFHGADYSTTQTGGYVVQLMQTKCRRLNGNILSDSFQDRGALQYVIMPSGQNPNDPANAGTAMNIRTVPFGGSASAIVDTGDGHGSFWFKINNDPADYKDSTGSYTISIAGEQVVGTFTLQILNPLLDLVRSKIYGIAVSMFSNMICYKHTPTSACMGLFTYIRALLMLYVLFIGFQFLIGAEITQEALIKHILKIVIVSGVINGSTFEFFHQNIYPLVVGFTDQIISNMSGFSALSSTNSVSNPFMFLDALMSKMFLNPTFFFQVLSTFGMGLTGFLYFIIICVSVIIFIIAIFRAMAVYIMAMIATAFLIAMTPIFIVCILFDQTYPLFETWTKYLFRFMMEPVIVMAGIIILTQLFSLYIDQVLSYSLCWKCAIPIHLPFASFLPFPGLVDIPIFCIYWFSPWGLSPINDTMGMDMAMMVGLVMIAYCSYCYVEFAGKISSTLSAAGGTSAIATGSAMASDMAQKQLAKYGLDKKGMAAAKNRLKQGMGAQR